MRGTAVGRRHVIEIPDFVIFLKTTCENATDKDTVVTLKER